MDSKKDRILFDDQYSLREEPVVSDVKTDVDLERMFQRLRSAKLSPEEHAEQVMDALLLLKEEFTKIGASYYDDVSAMYPQLTDTYIVRRDDISRVSLGLVSGDGFDIDYLKADNFGKTYGNCVEWSYKSGARGLSLAFTEGLASVAGVVSVMGIKPRIGLQAEKLTEPDSNQHGTEGIFLLTVNGHVTPKDVKFLVLRFPLDFMPEEELTPSELLAIDEDRAPKHVFRGFIFP